jgi:Recombinase
MTAEIQAAGCKTRVKRSQAWAANFAPVIVELRAAGVVTLGAIASALTERGIPTARGGSQWSRTQVSRVLAALEGRPRPESLFGPA